MNLRPPSSVDHKVLKTNVTAYWRDPHLEEVNLRYMQQQTRSEIVHIACRIGNENCATQVNFFFELHNFEIQTLISGLT